MISVKVNMYGEDSMMLKTLEKTIRNVLHNFCVDKQQSYVMEASGMVVVIPTEKIL